MTETKEACDYNMIIKSVSIHSNGVLDIWDVTGTKLKKDIDVEPVKDKINKPLRFRNGFAVVKSVKEAGEYVEISVTAFVPADDSVTMVCEAEND